MLLIFLVYVPFFFMATTFIALFIALMWDYARGISPFGKKMDAPNPELSLNETNQNFSPKGLSLQPAEPMDTSVG